MDNNQTNKKIILGIVLIIIGTVLALDDMRIIPSSWIDILISWQMLMIGIGVILLNNGKRVGGTILIFLGAFFLVPEMINIPYRLLEIKWPIFIILIGVTLIYVSNKKSRLEKGGINEHNSQDSINDFIIFSGKHVIFNSQNFLGGEVTTIFGGTEYQLQNSKLSDNGAVINCVALFGGCEIRVPEDWKIRNEVSAIFGGFSDKRVRHIEEESNEEAKTLVIKGFAAFGGIEVKN